MGRLFNMDNPVWRFVGKLADAVMLNIMWVIFSIPIVTIGASTTALYYCCMKVVQDREGTSLFKDFWKSFQENFRQSTIIWLITLVIAVVLVLDICYYWSVETQVASFICMAFVVLLLILVMLWHYVFAVQAKFINPVKKTLMFAAILPLRYILYTIPMLLITVAMLVAVWFYPPLLLFGMGAVAFFHSYFLLKVFDKYIRNEEEEEEFEEEEPVHVVIDDLHQEHVVLEASSEE